MSYNRPLQHKIKFESCPISLCGVFGAWVICSGRICFPGLIYCDQEPLWLLTLQSRLLLFGCTYKAIKSILALFHSRTVCKSFFSKITKPFPQKSHECAKVFDLN